jgi:uncharacterized LabA/DUF88 family protein
MLVSEVTPPTEAFSPPPKRAVAFVDGQNLFHAAAEAFGYDYPNYHPLLLADRICAERRWRCQQARLYTGVPKLADNEFWHKFWAAKKRFLNREERMFVFTRDTHYRDKRISFEHDAGRITLADGFPLQKGTLLFLPSGKTAPGEFWVRTGEEKGIDVRIALDMIRLTYRNEFDVGIIFSQDQDLSEAVSEVRELAKDQRRGIEMFCAFPRSRNTTNTLPIRGTTAIEIDQAFYDACLDPSNYRRPK